jgi:ribosome-associated protein
MHNQTPPPSEGLGEAFMETYELNGEEYIELIKLLKIMRVSESGGQAKLMVEDGIVFRNGEPEFRKRAKLRAGDVIEVFEYKIRIE